jgi:hypothetical protein
MLPVSLKMNNMEIFAEALVDSGSDENVFDAQYAGLLGIEDLEEGGIEKKIVGVTGVERKGYAHEVVLRFDAYHFFTTVIFLPDMEDDLKAILGQAGFFEFVKVTFERSKGTFEIVPQAK